MATGRTDITSDEIINIKCCLCLEDNRTREADKYCMDCNSYYCTPCTDIHRKFPSMKGHKLLDKGDLQSLGSDRSLPSFVTQRCLVHPTKVVDMYCRTHDEVACKRCIALTHRACTTIHSITEEVDNLYNRTELTTMKQKIQEAKKNMQEIKTAKDKKMTEINKAFDTEVKSVKNFRQEMQALLDNMEEETIRELKQQFDNIMVCLQGEINTISSLIEDMNEASSQLLKSEGNKPQEFVSIKTSQQVVVQADVMEKEQQKKTEESVRFTADHNIKAFLQQLPALGKVTGHLPNILNIKDSLYKVKQQREIMVNFVNDSSMPNILGSCVTEKGILLLTDYNNKKLKRIDLSTETMKDYLDLSGQPVAVCLVSTTEAAVTIYDTKTVQFVSLGTQLGGTRKLKMKHTCWGLAYNNSKLFISDIGKNVYIYDTNGRELKRISTNTIGENIFQRTRHITVSAAGDRVFVADAGNGGVILDIQGNYLSTLTDHKSQTFGVCTDERNLFVCGMPSHNVVQIGKDYKMSGELVKVTHPTSLCFDHGKIRLIVTHSNHLSITVLDLE